ncbi:MAG: hypothetical protein WCT50_03360 [Patescibacteria group bacterium]|jgi:hypothetical protein
MKEPLVNEELRKSLEKPNFLAIDLLIKEKLKTAGIILCDTNNEIPTLENGVKFFENELLKRDRATVIIFTHYCLAPIMKLFREASIMKLCFESSSFATIAMIFAGYAEAGLAKGINSIPNKNHVKLITTLPTLFEQNEFENIISCSKYILSGFLAKTKEAIKWLKEDIEPQKKQADALKEFINLLREDGFNEEQDKKSKEKTTQRVLDVCMPGGVDNNHNLYTLKTREQFGMFSPDKELLIDIDRIFIYLDILSFAGFLPKNLPENALELNFTKNDFNFDKAT